VVGANLLSLLASQKRRPVHLVVSHWKTFELSSHAIFVDLTANSPFLVELLFLSSFYSSFSFFDGILICTTTL